jgi:heat shock protein HslJ
MIITPSVAPTPIVEEIIPPTPLPIQLDVDKLLANKHWLLQTKESSKAYIIFDMKKQYAFGSGGCNKFQGGYQVDQSRIVFNQFIASSKYCDQFMEVETYFLSALPKVTNWLVKDGGKTLYFYADNKLLLLQFSAK